MAKRYNKEAQKIYKEYLNCKQLPAGHDVHHIIPVKKGGTDEIDNLVLVNGNDHPKMHTCLKKNPTKEEILEEEILLNGWLTVKELKIIPEPDYSAVKPHGECQECMILNKTVLFFLKEEGISNIEIVEMFEGKLGLIQTFNRNWKILGWPEELFNDRKNGIYGLQRSEAIKGKNNPMYGKTHSEETKQKQSKQMKGKPRPRSDEILQKNKNKRLARFKRWLIAEANGLSVKKFNEKEKISISTFYKLIKEFKNQDVNCSEKSLN